MTVKMEAKTTKMVISSDLTMKTNELRAIRISMTQEERSGRVLPPTPRVRGW